MPDPFTDGEGELQRAEHISPRKTGDNIAAKRVATYVWNSTTSEWERMTQPGGSSSSPEYIKLAGSDANERDSTFYGDGITSGVMAVHERYFDGAAYNRTPASKTLVDKSTTTDVIYIGKAPIGTATSAASWQIKKIDKTVTDNVTITFAAAGAFTATWNNRGSETYS